jgi:hypothetical protein
LKTGSRWFAVVALALVAALAVSACGKSKKKSAAKAPGANTLSLTISDAGKTARYTAPTTVKGGLLTVSLTNDGKAPHQAQLAMIGSHSPQEVFKIVSASGNVKVPAWLRAEGGVGATPPGKAGTATVNLQPGKYVVFDPPNGPSGGSGPPAYSLFTVTAGAPGSLPSTPTTVTANEVGKDKFRWDLSGAPLKPGVQSVTFDSKGKTALHLLAAFRVTGNPSKAELIKALKSNGKPPAFVDQSSFYSGTVLDGGKSQVQELALTKPGNWVLFCPLNDRDGGKPHFAEGLLKTVTVK